jgi:hypothetical protein
LLPKPFNGLKRSILKGWISTKLVLLKSLYLEGKEKLDYYSERTFIIHEK